MSFARSLEALEEDCARGAVVISQREAKSPCAAKLVDRSVWREKGALALRFTGARFEESFARPTGLDRPWAHGPASEPVVAPPRPSPRDATPPKETLEADD